MNEHLPDCMMPDGAEPCAGYRELESQLAAHEEWNARCPNCGRTHFTLTEDKRCQPCAMLARINELERERDELRAELGKIECSRSHPHENMGPVCELKTQMAKVVNEAAHLRAENERLREAATALGVMPDGICFCSKNRSGGRGWHEPECRNLRAALAKGE